jgi:hypothetical protein
MTRHRAAASVVMLAILALALGGAAPADDLRSPEMPTRVRPPGEGVICAMGLYNIIAEVGRRCMPGQDPAFQAELNRAITQIDDYVLRNSTLTPADLNRFKREQALLGAPEARLCRNDLIAQYRHAASMGGDRLREETRLLLARPGPPTWGDCL